MLRRLLALTVLTALPVTAAVAFAAPASAVCLTGPLAPVVGCNPVCSNADKVLAELGFGPLNCVM